jgi:type II secretion system protein C
VSISLSMQSLKGIDINVVATRLLRRQNIALFVRAVQILCVIIGITFALLLAFLFTQGTLTRKSLESELSNKVDAIKRNATTQEQPISSDKQDWTLVSNFSSFGPLGVRPSNSTAPVAPPATPLMLTLIGTFISAGQEPYAIIEDKKKQTQDMFLLEQMVFGQARLKKIYQDRVEVERSGKIEVLKLDDFGGGDGGAGVSSSGDDFVVDEAELDKGLENLPMLLTQARAVPYFKDGRSIGLRLFAIKTGSLYEKIGLKNGDILKSINGNSLGDISQALKLFEQLKQERSISLVLERDKQDREFKYTIR